MRVWIRVKIMVMIRVRVRVRGGSGPFQRKEGLGQGNFHK